MKDNTPPRPAEIQDDLDDINDEDDGIRPDDEDEWLQADDDELFQRDYENDSEMEAITLEELEELESRLAADEPFDGSDGETVEEQNIAPVKDDALLTFRHHSAPVFACAMHPHNDLCATGGEDDKVFIWNQNNGQIIKEITDHKDTVTDVHFNHDGTYLATGDMAGDIFLYKLRESSDNSFTVTKVWEYSMGDMSWMCWHKSANVLIAGTEDGEIYIFRLPLGACKILPGQGVRSESGEITGDGKKLYASYSNGIVKLWDIKTATVVMEVDERHPMVHQEGSCTLTCDKESPLYVSGDESGKLLFCTNYGPIGTVQVNGAIECLAISPSSDFRMVACGTLSGQVSIWELSKLTLRAECEYADNGITKIQWISDFTILVSTLAGNMVAFDARTGQKKFVLSGHTADIYSFCYNPKERLALTVSEDKLSKIYKVPDLGD